MHMHIIIYTQFSRILHSDSDIYYNDVFVYLDRILFYILSKIHSYLVTNLRFANKFLSLTNREFASYNFQEIMFY